MKLKCGITNEILNASEPKICHYEFEFSTPYACDTKDLTEDQITFLKLYLH